MSTQQQLVGSWHLRRWIIHYSDSETEFYPFGEQPQGLLVYTADGWMSAAINQVPQPLFSSEGPLRKLPAAELAAAYVSYFHYSGRYRIEGEQVIHTVSQSLNPGFVGSEQVRKMHWHEGGLMLSGEEQVGQRMRLHRLYWQRV